MQQPSKVHVTVQSDLTEVREDLSRLKFQMTELADTVERLNENGINVKLKISLDTNKFKKFFSAFARK